MSKNDFTRQYLPIGTFVGDDRETHEVMMYVQKLIRIVDAKTCRPFPSAVVNNIKVLNKIRYPDEIKQGWARYRSANGTDWLLHEKQAGKAARKNHLETLWDNARKKREKGGKIKQEELDGLAEVGKPPTGEPSRGELSDRHRPSRRDEPSLGGRSLVEPIDGNQLVNLPEAIMGSKVFPRKITYLNTSIEIARYINPIAWKQYERNAYKVIDKFLSGDLLADHQRSSGPYTSLDAVESAFWKYGYRINTSHAVLASRDVEAKNAVNSVLKSRHWIKGLSCLFVEGKKEGFNWARRLLYGEKLEYLEARMIFQDEERTSISWKRKAIDALGDNEESISPVSRARRADSEGHQKHHPVNDYDNTQVEGKGH